MIWQEYNLKKYTLWSTETISIKSPSSKANASPEKNNQWSTPTPKVLSATEKVPSLRFR